MNKILDYMIVVCIGIIIGGGSFMLCVKYGLM